MASIALLSSILWGFSDFFGGSASRKMASRSVVLGAQLAGLIAAGLVAFLVNGWSDDPGYIPWAVAAGACGAIGLFLYYEALAIGTMGTVAPPAALAVVVPVVTGLFAGKAPSLLVDFGFILAIIGVLFTSGFKVTRIHFSRPLALAIASATFVGIGMVLIARGAEYSPLMTMVAMRATSVAILGLVTIFLSSRHFQNSASTRPQRIRLYSIIGLSGVLDVTANFLFAFATRVASLAVVSVLGSLHPIVIAFLARAAYKERLNRVQLSGAALTLAGVLVIAGFS